MTNEAVAQDPTPGTPLRPAGFTLTAETVADYLAGLGLDSASEQSRTAFPSPAAPSMLVHLADDVTRRGSGFPNSFGTLWTRQQWKLSGPVIIGRPYHTAGRIVDVYEYHTRMVVLTETTVLDSDEAVVAVGRHHQSYITHQNAGEVELRAPSEKRAPERPATGERLRPIERTVTLDMCRRLFPNSTGYHTNADASKRQGFQNVVVGGRVPLYYLGEVLERHFGRSWWAGGEIELKFTNVIWPDDHLIASGTLTGVVNGRQQVELDVAKADGTIVTVAHASVPLSGD